jgi:hypothetical protein
LPKFHCGRQLVAKIANARVKITDLHGPAQSDASGAVLLLIQVTSFKRDLKDLLEQNPKLKGALNASQLETTEQAWTAFEYTLTEFIYKEVNSLWSDL